MPHMMDDFPLLLSTLYDRAVPAPPRAGDRLGRGRQEHPADHIRRDRRRGAPAGDCSWRAPRRSGVGEPVGTFAWNNQRHHELYWSTANTGRICHTINIRLFADQIVYIVNHAGGSVLFVDPDLVALSGRSPSTGVSRAVRGHGR